MEIEEIITIFIALLAFFTTLWNVWISRKHQRLSVKPRLVGLSIIRGKADFHGFKLVNNGIGPAELTAVNLYLDGKLQNSSHSSWSRALASVGLDSKIWNLIRVTPGYTLRAGEEIWIFRTEKIEIDDANDVIKALSRLSLEFGYKSMYNEKQPTLVREIARMDQLIEEDVS